MKKKEESINKLIQLVKLTTKERDEAKDQLNALVSFLRCKKPQQAAAINSGLTESDSLSETQTRISHRSHVSSPVESFYHAESSNITTAAATKFDFGSVVIDELAKKRPLPEKGKLMQAVMNAGPLLQTLMVAGPLPRWRNPPTMQVQAGGSSHGSQLCMKRRIALPLDNGFADSGAKQLRNFWTEPELELAAQMMLRRFRAEKIVKQLVLCPWWSKINGPGLSRKLRKDHFLHKI